MNEYKYYCNLCDYGNQYKSKFDRHINGNRHKHKLPPKLIKCPHCKYRSYQKHYVSQHLRKCKKLYEGKVFKAAEPVPPPLKKIYKKEDLQNEINELLMRCMKLKINPNDYFYYQYYAQNLDKLTIPEYQDFLAEMKYIFK